MTAEQPTYMRLTCPLCAWEGVVRGPTVVDPNALAGIFGVGVLSSVALNNFHTIIEATLREHFQTHTLAEWVLAVKQRDDRIKELSSGQ